VKYENAQSFSEGLALFWTDDLGHYVDRAGRTVLRLPPGSSWPFSDGLTIAELSGEEKYFDRGE
jgi:hypothetical protein